MAKTRRDLLLEIAKRIGGERGRRMRQAIRKCELAHMLDRPVTDAEFEAQIKNAERELPAILATYEDVGTEPGSWDFPN